MAYLELQDLTKVFHVRKGLLSGEVLEVRAVDGVSLKIQKGEILGLVGESGCGKTTLSRLIMQLEAPTAGRIVLDGEALAARRGPHPALAYLDSVVDAPRQFRWEALRQAWREPAETRKRRIEFQMIFQDPYASLNPRMTVFSTLAEAVRQRHPEARDVTERVIELMERVGLAARDIRKYPHEFSGGQRQRIAVARAIAPEPKLIIADEPVSALDVSIQSQILNLLRKLSQELGLTMMFISHDLSVVRYIADRIVVMQSGRFVEEGEAEALFAEPRHPYTRDLLSAIPRIAKFRSGGAPTHA